MKLLPSPRRSALVARVEVRRALRSFVADRTRLAITALSGLFVALFVAVATYLLYRAGQSLRAGGALAGFDVGPTVRGAVGLVGVGLAALVAARAVGKRGTVPEADGLLTTVPTADAVGGMVLSELAFVLLWTLPPLGLFAGSFAYGARTPAPLLAIAPVVLLLGGLAVATGYAVGLAVRQVVTRHEVLARHRQVLFGLAFLGYFALVFTGGINELGALLLDPLARTPVGWLGDLLLLGTPGVTGSPLRAVAGPVLVLAATVPVFAGTVRIAARHWFSDPVSASSGDDDGADADGGLGRFLPDVSLPLPSSRLSRPTRAVATTAVKRAVRAPIKLAYVAYPLFGAIPLAQTAIEQGQVPPSLPYVVAGYGGWVAGIPVTLNLFGDQGAVLPGTLTTPVSGRQFVTGHVVVAVVAVAPLVTLLTAVVGVASPLALGRVAALVAAAAVLSVLTPLLATGVGTLFPRYGSVTVVGSREAVMPSKRAFLAYTAALAAAALAAGTVFVDGIAELLAVVLSFLLPRVTVTAGPLELAATAALVVLAAAPFASVAYAVRRFDEYRFD
ncbi:hypothetical protein [Halostella litorea]|uniref:hypothetical protein n=1 Tax=Halostella litorea TaxID=2528831 RepID=UPI001092F3BB|nr:hypothetical protein [Halostella litorea]